jgi:hypothetical protein
MSGGTMHLSLIAVRYCFAEKSAVEQLGVVPAYGRNVPIAEIQLTVVGVLKAVAPGLLQG